jgi:hypothetical protein
MPYSTAQHLPRRKASPGRVVYATSENRTGRVTGLAGPSALISWRDPGDDTTVRVVTGEIPVRFVGLHTHQQAS